LKTISQYVAAQASYPITPDSPVHLDEYRRILNHSVKLRSHLEVLVWLQGDMQRYLPHDIMIAAWGNFRTGQVRNDIVSTLHGVRSHHGNDHALTPVLVQLFADWQAGDRHAYVDTDLGFETSPQTHATNPLLAHALGSMRCALVHGIKDERGSPDCLYLALSGFHDFNAVSCNTFTQILPYIDHVLRQVKHLPHQSGLFVASGQPRASESNLTARELEILQWIAMGKTNSEIGSIVELSLYTVKNHVQRIFKKLNVSNRAQAIAVLTHRV
jgi:transcriptional regulator EpsA